MESKKMKGNTKVMSLNTQKDGAVSAVMRKLLASGDGCS